MDTGEEDMKNATRTKLLFNKWSLKRNFELFLMTLKIVFVVENVYTR